MQPEDEDQPSPPEKTNQFTLRGALQITVLWAVILGLSASAAKDRGEAAVLATSLMGICLILVGSIKWRPWLVGCGALLFYAAFALAVIFRIALGP